MFVCVMKSTAIFLIAIWVATNGAFLSSDFQFENLSLFCPFCHGQKVAHDCLGTVFTESGKVAEDTGYSA